MSDFRVPASDLSRPDQPQSPPLNPSDLPHQCLANPANDSQPFSHGLQTHHQAKSNPAPAPPGLPDDFSSPPHHLSTSHPFFLAQASPAFAQQDMVHSHLLLASPMSLHLPSSSLPTSRAPTLAPSSRSVSSTHTPSYHQPPAFHPITASSQHCPPEFQHFTAGSQQPSMGSAGSTGLTSPTPPTPLPPSTMAPSAPSASKPPIPSATHHFSTSQASPHTDGYPQRANHLQTISTSFPPLNSAAGENHSGPSSHPLCTPVLPVDISNQFMGEMMCDIVINHSQDDSRLQTIHSPSAAATAAHAQSTSSTDLHSATRLHTDSTRTSEPMPMHSQHHHHQSQTSRQHALPHGAARPVMSPMSSRKHNQPLHNHHHHQHQPHHHPLHSPSISLSHPLAPTSTAPASSSTSMHALPSSSSSGVGNLAAWPNPGPARAAAHPLNSTHALKTPALSALSTMSTTKIVQQPFSTPFSTLSTQPHTLQRATGSISSPSDHVKHPHTLHQPHYINSFGLSSTLMANNDSSLILLLPFAHTLPSSASITSVTSPASFQPPHQQHDGSGMNQSFSALPTYCNHSLQTSPQELAYRHPHFHPDPHLSQLPFPSTPTATTPPLPQLPPTTTAQDDVPTLAAFNPLTLDLQYQFHAHPHQIHPQSAAAPPFPALSPPNYSLPTAPNTAATTTAKNNTAPPAALATSNSSSTFNNSFPFPPSGPGHDNNSTPDPFFTSAFYPFPFTASSTLCPSTEPPQDIDIVPTPSNHNHHAHSHGHHHHHGHIMHPTGLPSSTPTANSLHESAPTLSTGRTGQPLKHKYKTLTDPNTYIRPATRSRVNPASQPTTTTTTASHLQSPSHPSAFPFHSQPSSNLTTSINPSSTSAIIPSHQPFATTYEAHYHHHSPHDSSDHQQHHVHQLQLPVPSTATTRTATTTTARASSSRGSSPATPSVQDDPLWCNICDKQFDKKTHHQKHMKKHAPQRLHSCNYCPKRFTTQTNARIHMNTHTNVKPFECGSCGKRFTQISTLRNHELIHSGERPHRCACGRSFTQLATLIAHVRRGIHPNCARV